MLNRIFGILTFRRPTYLEVAKNASVIGQAVILVAISSLLDGRRSAGRPAENPRRLTRAPVKRRI
jgi:hypothetical protein